MSEKYSHYWESSLEEEEIWFPEQKWWTRIFFSPNYPEIAQILVGFILGFLLAPFSNGILYIILFLLFWEIVFAYITKMRKPWWNPLSRLLVMASYFVGFLFGRIWNGVEPFE